MEATFGWLVDVGVVSVSVLLTTPVTSALLSDNFGLSDICLVLLLLLSLEGLAFILGFVGSDLAETLFG